MRRPTGIFGEEEEAATDGLELRLSFSCSLTLFLFAVEFVSLKGTFYEQIFFPKTAGMCIYMTPDSFFF